VGQAVKWRLFPGGVTPLERVKSFSARVDKAGTEFVIALQVAAISSFPLHNSLVTASYLIWLYH
jgi:hypothetical protein